MTKECERKRVLVTGAAGMVGGYIREIFGDMELFLTDIRDDYLKLDISDFGLVKKTVSDIRPHLVFHLAAATDVDRCQLDRKWAYACNGEATGNIAAACNKIGAMMIYPSSGSLFSGSKKMFAVESDTPDPVNVYGESKLEGEKAVIDNVDKYIIARAGWMMGGGPEKDIKFVGKILAKIFSGSTELKVIDDKFGSPTYAKDFLKGIRFLLETGLEGLYHLVNGEVCSRYDMITEILSILKLRHVNVIPVSSAEFPLSAPRAVSEGLKSERLPKRLEDIMHPWQEALKEYLFKDWGLHA